MAEATVFQGVVSIPTLVLALAMALDFKRDIPRNAEPAIENYTSGVTETSSLS